MKIYKWLIFYVIIISCNQSQEKKEQGAFIIDVFRKLPIIGISLDIKYELLTQIRIDSTKENLQYAIDIDSINNSILIQSSIAGCYGSSCPYNNYYIKSFKVNNELYKIVLSNCLIVPGNNSQEQFDIFDYYLSSKLLMKDTVSYPALNIQLKDFFNINTPDSIIDKLKDNITPTYSFNNDLLYCVISDYGDNYGILDNKWLEGNTIEIKWNGKYFVRSRIILIK